MKKCTIITKIFLYYIKISYDDEIIIFTSHQKATLLQ